MKIIRYIRTILFYLSLPIFYILGRLFPASNIKNEESEFIDGVIEGEYIGPVYNERTGEFE